MSSTGGAGGDTTSSTGGAGGSGGGTTSAAGGAGGSGGSVAPCGPPVPCNSDDCWLPAAPADYPAPYGPEGLRLADMNGDGWTVTSTWPSQIDSTAA